MSAESPSVEFGTTPAETGATKIKAAVDYRSGELVDLSTGKAVILPALEGTTAVPGGKLFWRSTRNWKDDQGNRHIFYRQRFNFSDPLAGLLPDPYSFEGVPLSGGMLSLHYDNEGVLYFASGAYFEDIRVPAEMSLGTPLAALTHAWAALGTIDGHDMADFLSLDESTREELLEFTKLKLASTGDGKTFAFVWEAPAWLADGASLMAALDGATGDLLHFWDPNPHWSPSPCGPRSNIGASATADPQNPLIVDRTGLAATPSNATPGFTHEAHWPESSGAPVPIWGYRGIRTDGCAAFPGFQYYELVPLQTEGQQPHYGGGVGFEDQQKVGDAVWKTYLTMDFFDDLNWDGFDDQGTRAKVVVEGICWAGAARFVRSPPFDKAPVNSVLICQKSTTQTYSVAASLDVVAHEWGHGVIFESAGWEYDTDAHKVVHEGWADIVGHAVEWRKESPGTGAENADWKFSEDSQDPERQVNKDDFDPLNPGNPHPYSYHAVDPCDPPSGEPFGPHYCGMPLAVAFWLAADGGTDDGLFERLNPLCRHPGNLPSGPPGSPEVDCDLEVTPMGDWTATRVFFTALTTYIGEAYGWDDFAEAVKFSAHELYKYWFSPEICSNAIDKQDIIQDAFTAIGYGGATPSHRYYTYYTCDE
ncbi:MAG: hypothetical protein ABFS37_04525 [Acidobacteriota bacterium]